MLSTTTTKRNGQFASLSLDRERLTMVWCISIGILTEQC